MKVFRLCAMFVCGAMSLAVFSGCETQRSACEREKRLTERMDEMQMNIDTQMQGVNGEFASLRANPPVIVQQAAPIAPTTIDSISIEDDLASKRRELEDLAEYSRQQQLYQPQVSAPRASGGNHIRVPVPARTVQAALKEAGFYNGAIDGKVGRGTIAAISSFQRSQGIKADGIVGRVTWQHLQAFVPAGMATTRLK